jgi:hypothetical protein
MIHVSWDTFMQRRSFLIHAGGIMAGLCAGSAIVAPPTAAAELTPQRPNPNSSPNPSKPPLKKRALLLGISQAISQKPEEAITAEILNDLLLQQQLLQLRYGFSDQEILRLTDGEVTVEQVTTAIAQHFEGAEVGIFHFSGLLNDAAELSLSDGTLGLNTLAEQLKSLKIRHLTTVLDLKTNTQIPTEILSKFPGLLVHPNSNPQANPQTSLTQDWTQTLWNQEKITVKTAVSNAWKLTGDRKNESAYFITPLQTLGAGAVQQIATNPIETSSIQPNQIANNQILVWLGGLNPDALALVGPGSILQVQHDRRLEQLQVIERHDRSATAIASGSVAMGDPIVESLRRIPRNLELKLILGKTLSKIKTVDAISAFSDVKSIALLKPDPKTSVPKNADYIFTQIKPEQPNRYGLISASARDFVEGTLAESDETIKVAVRRLVPKLRSLQARKQLLTTLHDETTSVPTLAVKAQLNRVNEKNNSLQPIQTLPKKTGIQSGDRLRYQIQNLGRSPLYWLLWQWDSTLESTIVLPPLASSLGSVSGGGHQPVMSGIARPDWTVRSIGKTESFLICSLAPFMTTSSQLSPLQDDRFVHRVTDPLAVVEALFTDLQGSMEPMSETYSLNLAQFMTFPFHYHVFSSL